MKKQQEDNATSETDSQLTVGSSKWKTMYSQNVNYRENKIKTVKDKYESDNTYRQSKLTSQKDRYERITTYRKSKINNGKKRYKLSKIYRQSLIQAGKHKYRLNQTYRQSLIQAGKKKYKNSQTYRQSLTNANKIRYENTEYREHVKRIKLLRYRKNVLIREEICRRMRHLYKHDLAVRQRKILLVQQRRLKIIDKRNSIAAWFRQQVTEGPKYVCSVCHKFKFKKKIIHCDKNRYEKKGGKILAIANQCITSQYYSNCTADCLTNCTTPNHKQWICYTCHQNILKGKMPADASVNGLQLSQVPDDLKSLNNVEKQLISLRIPFMKMVQLPKGNQRGIIGPCVSVPTDIEKTTNVLPRTDDAQLIRCKLKRKLSYKGHSQYEFVSPKKILKTLEYLKESNPYYQDKLLNETCFESIPTELQDIAVEDPQLPEIQINNNCQQNEHPLKENSSLPDKESENTDEVPTEDHCEEDEEQVLRDRGLPADTCLQPVDFGQEILDQHFDNIFCVAPAEGNTPVSMLQEEGNEAMSFPAQFPEGKFGSFDTNRPVHLTRSRYFHSRLFNADNRFSSDSCYIFYAQYLSELEQVISKVSIAMRKSSGKDAGGNAITASMLTDRNQLKKLLTTDQGYKFMTPIRGTPPYWQAALKDLMSTIRQIGIPTFFATFSAADMRWTELIQVLLEQQKSTKSVENLDWTAKSEVLKNNPVMNAVMFDHRFHTFLKEIIIKQKVIGEVQDHFHRIEFQQRGSPHAHCLFWIKDAPLLDKDDDQTVCDFVEKYISCDLPDKTLDPELHEIVSTVQQHSKNHAKTCKKKGTTCRFNFPRPPSEKTFISRCQSLTDPSVQQSPQEMKANAQDVLRKLWNAIQNDSIEYITSQDLFAAAGITQKDFQEASNILTKRTNIILKRNPSNIWINQYNPDLLRCWNANMDIQYVNDPYSCVMYIISYISKAEREMGMVLENAQKEAAEGNCDAQQAMKKIGGAYFRQREVSAQEAAYRVCGLHLKESSRKVQFIPAGVNQVKMSLPLNVIKMKSSHLEDDNIWMMSLYDRYKERPDTVEFDGMCYASFCSEYRVLSTSQIPKNPSQFHFFKLKNNTGYIQKRSRTDSAIVRYPRFSLKKNPEVYYQTNLQLFLPHRTDAQLKPDQFDTFEQMYLSGAVVVKPSVRLENVRTIVDANRQRFEKNAEELDEAQDIINKQGPLEDAWALIAPESEAERLEGQKEKEHVTEEDHLEIPELDTPKKDKHGSNFEIQQTLLESQQMQTSLQQLNKEQKTVFYKIRQWCLDKLNGQNPEPFQIFINGGAGTGKSHLIKCLYYETKRILSPAAPNPDDIVVLLTAPTATAAFNIGGTTLHQAFSLSKSLPLPYIYKRDDELNKLRSKLQNLTILIIDEISMVGQRVLLYVSERLRQIKQSGNARFGNTCVIAVGDFYQLPPVKQKCVYDLRPDNYFPLWSLNFSVVDLQQIMRQKNDSVFANLLNRLRVKKKNEQLLPDDRAILETCTKHEVPADTLHIFGTNKEVDHHNNTMIHTVCETTETVPAYDFDKNPQTGKLIPTETPYDTTHDYLPSQLIIGPKARVMLIRNVDISCGLVNGAMGTVTHVLPSSDSTLQPSVMVLFDNKKICTTHSHTIHPKKHLPIKITSFEENLNNNAVRHQLPLQLAWACTIHKVQGITTDTAVVSMKHIFAPGMAYVALSRLKTMDGLVIKDLDENNIYCNEQISDALQRMPQYLHEQLPLQNTKQNHHLKVLLHNIQGLIPHIKDLQANSDIHNVDLICLTETWMETTSATPQLNNFHLIHQPRYSSYSPTTDLFNKLKQNKHGGVGIYIKKEQNYSQLSLDAINMECIAINIKNIETNLLLIYRPESYTGSIFMEQMNQLLAILQDDHRPTLVMGDFNQDILKDYNSIKLLMTQHGFKQIVTQPTTDGGTLLDHVYLHGNLNISLNVVQTYYSYHNMVALDITVPSN